jgi:hypothetical protein
MEIFALIAHLLTSVVRVAPPGGVRAVIAESLLLKHQLLVLSRSRNRAPRLTPWDRRLFGVGAFVVAPNRLPILLASSLSRSVPHTSRRLISNSPWTGNTGEIEAVSRGTEFLTSFLNVVVSVVQVSGIPLGEGFLAATTKALILPGAPTTSSLYRDLQEGNPVEADQILGDLLRRGAEAGLGTPLISAAYTHLCVHQNRVAPARSTGSRPSLSTDARN